MRNFISLVLSFLIILATVPAVSLTRRDEIRTKAETTLQTSDAGASEAAATSTVSRAPSSATKTDKVRVFLHKEKKVVSVSKLFYIISVLAKEIDIHAPQEALKAQAVCIQSFLMRSSQLLKDKPYDITDDPAKHQSFLSEKALKAFWGDAYEENYSDLKKTVKSVYGKILTFENEPILAAYHSSNAGMTESAENCWGNAYAYLRAVPSIGDTLCADYQSEVTLDAKTFKKKIGAIKNYSFSFSDSPSDWIGASEKTASGTVKTMEIGKTALTGAEIRKALGLKSAFFDVAYQNGKFVFTVHGYGHGVGLSQEGAKYMAQIGFSYEEILLYYYEGVEITNENAV